MPPHTAAPAPDAATRETLREAQRACAAHGRALQAFLAPREEAESLAWMRACIEGAAPLFAPWCLEILFVLSTRGETRFSQLSRALAGVSSRTLSDKLLALQQEGLVEKRVRLEQGSRVAIRYALTKDGLKAATLVAPLMTFANRGARLRGRAAEPA